MSKSEVPGARVGGVDSGISNMQVAFQLRQLGEENGGEWRDEEGKQALVHSSVPQ